VPCRAVPCRQNISRPNDTLRFPEYMWVSRNHFHLEWTWRKTLRRLKNVIVVLEWQVTPLYPPLPPVTPPLIDVLYAK
jgi:hypothetical protein